MALRALSAQASFLRKQAHPRFSLDRDIRLIVYLIRLACYIRTRERANRKAQIRGRGLGGRLQGGSSGFPGRRQAELGIPALASCNKARDRVIADRCLRLARAFLNCETKMREPGIASFTCRG